MTWGCRSWQVPSSGDRDSAVARRAAVSRKVTLLNLSTRLIHRPPALTIPADCRAIVKSSCRL